MEYRRACFLSKLSFYKHLHTEDNKIYDYAKRHQARFEMMKQNGSWDLLHPWYECFIDKSTIQELLPEILNLIPMYMGGIYHLFPVNAQKTPEYFMMPDGDEIFAFCILLPGIPHNLLDKTLTIIEQLDKLLLLKGGKRYLSGWIGAQDEAYWRGHYGNKFEKLRKLKKLYDPHSIFQSLNFDLT